MKPGNTTGLVRTLLGYLCMVACALILQSVSAQMSADERQRVIAEFEAQNRNQGQSVQQHAQAPQADKQAGSSELHQDLATARLQYLQDPTPDNRRAVVQATVNFVDPLIRLGQWTEAETALKLSISSLHGDDALSELFISIYLTQAEEQQRIGNSQAVLKLLDDAWQEAQRARLDDLEPKIAQKIGEMSLESAEAAYWQGDFGEARKHALEVVRWVPENRPALELLAYLAFLDDDYANARVYLQRAGITRRQTDHRYHWLWLVMAEEERVEKPYRKTASKDLVVLHSSFHPLHFSKLEDASQRARQQMEAVLGLKFQAPMRLSIYPRRDYLAFTQAPALWSKLVCYGGKLRASQETFNTDRPTLEMSMLYGYCHWLLQTLSRGNTPEWLTEGLAQQLCYPQGPPKGAINALRKEIQGDTLPSLETLEGKSPPPADLLEAAIQQAFCQTLVQTLLQEKGLDCLPGILQSLLGEVSAEEALRSQTGLNYDTLRTKTIDYINQPFNRPEPASMPELSRLGHVSPVGRYWVD